MPRKKRLKSKRKRAMRKRLAGGKKPMSPEQKLARKKLREAQKEASKKLKSK